MKDTKRILKIEVKRMDDPDSDTSYLGEYSNTATSEFSISRKIVGQYHYFNPGSVEPFNSAASWIPAKVADKRAYWLDAMRKNAAQDYARLEAFNNEEWGFIGIQATAEIVIAGVCQTIQSGGLWGIESDSEESYFRSIEREELTSLRGILSAMGFSKRAIASAVKSSK